MSSPIPRVPPSLATLAACLCLLSPATSPAATTDGETLEVLNCNDSGAGSLREAVARASDGAVVDLTGLACRRINLTSGALEVVQDNLTVRGRGISAMTLDGGLAASVLRHSGAGRLALKGLTVQRGFHHASTGEAHGGCVYSAGAVELRHARVRWCRALSGDGESEGGGVYARGPLTVLNSQVLGNTAYHAAGLRTLDRLQVRYSWICSNNSPIGTGGGAAADQGMEVRYSTFSGNKGGAIRAFGMNTTLIAHSTISGNHGRNTPPLWIIQDPERGSSDKEEGGGAQIVNSTISGNSTNRAVVSLNGFPNSIVNSTIAFNQLNSDLMPGCTVAAVELVNPQSPLHLDSTIIANNTCDGEPYSDLWIFWPVSPEVVGANNLVMRPIRIEMPPDTLNSDPMLEPLAANGGPTRTHALPPFSPAVDSGNNAAALSWDQRGRGYPRVNGVRADIGAFEY